MLRATDHPAWNDRFPLLSAHHDRHFPEYRIA
jgi:hypothetical protein